VHHDLAGEAVGLVANRDRAVVPARVVQSVVPVPRLEVARGVGHASDLVRVDMKVEGVPLHSSHVPLVHPSDRLTVDEVRLRLPRRAINPAAPSPAAESEVEEAVNRHPISREV